MQNIFGKLNYNFYLLLKDKNIWDEWVRYKILVKNNEEFTQRPGLNNNHNAYYICKHDEYYQKNLQCDDSESDIDNKHFFNQNNSKDGDDEDDRNSWNNEWECD